MLSKHTNKKLVSLTQQLLLIAICITLWGCPYESNVPISAPSISIDSTLLGSWRDTTDQYEVTRHDEFRYRVVVKNIFTGKYTDTFIAHLSRVGEEMFINLFSGPDKSYLICRIDERTAAGVRLSPISDKNLEQFSKPADLKNWIIRNAGNHSIFDAQLHLYRSDTYYSIFRPLSKSDSLKIVLESEHEDVNRMSIEKAIARIEIQHEFEKRQLEDSLKKEAMKKEYSFKRERERILTYGSYAGLLVVILLAYLAIMHFVRKQRSERIIANEKINTLLKEQELRSVSTMLNTQENERKRIASDLHDRLGSMLSTIKLYFGSVEQQMDKLKEQNKEQYNKATSLLDEACDEVRRISHDLISGELVKFGLVSALQQLAKTIADTGQLKVEVMAFGMDTRLDSSTEIALYRVVQELMNNVLKHSKAGKVTIQLNRADHDLNIVVEDNGVGFDIKHAKTKGGIGLQSIESRISRLNGKVHFDSGKGRGTTIIIDIPV